MPASEFVEDILSTIQDFDDVIGSAVLTAEDDLASDIDDVNRTLNNVLDYEYGGGKEFVKELREIRKLIVRATTSAGVVTGNLVAVRQKIRHLRALARKERG